jgi:hypothetical protein
MSYSAQFYHSLDKFPELIKKMESNKAIAKAIFARRHFKIVGKNYQNEYSISFSRTYDDKGKLPSREENFNDLLGTTDKFLRVMDILNGKNG